MTREEYLHQIFETFQLVSVLSERNHCTVLRLRHKTLGKDMILRSLPTPIAAYDELCAVECSNLPTVYESKILEDGQVVLEEFINGITLADSMEVTTYNYRSAKKIMINLCNALTVLHDRKIIHRDIKPENILLDNSGRVILIDLGISRKVNNKNRDTQIMGTVGYTSPEQLGIAQSDARTDIYSMGVLMNILLTGKHPSEVTAGGRAKRIIQKCTQITPSSRYQTAKQLARALEKRDLSNGQVPLFLLGQL